MTSNSQNQVTYDLDSQFGWRDLAFAYQQAYEEKRVRSGWPANAPLTQTEARDYAQAAPFRLVCMVANASPNEVTEALNAAMFQQPLTPEQQRIVDIYRHPAIEAATYIIVLQGRIWELGATV